MCVLKGALCPSPALTPRLPCWAETHHGRFSFSSGSLPGPTSGGSGGQLGGRRDGDPSVHLPVLQRLGLPASPAFSAPRSNLNEPLGGTSTHWAALPPQGSEGRSRLWGPRKGALPTSSAGPWVLSLLFQLPVNSTCLHSLY